jgi:hypothetical protein
MMKVYAKLGKIPFLFLTDAHFWTCVDEGAKEMTEA